MEIDNWWIAGNTPVQQYTILTPFGQYAGNMTNDITDFQAGPQPDSLFAVPHESSCTKSPNCGNSVHLAVRSVRGRTRLVELHR